MVPYSFLHELRWEFSDHRGKLIKGKAPSELSMPMPSQDYQALLKRARDNLPDDISKGSRFELPEVDGRVVKKNIEDKLDSFMDANVYCQE